VTLAHVTHDYFQGVYTRDNSQENLVVNDGVEEETVQRGIVAVDKQKDPGPDGIFPLILTKIVLIVKKPLAILFYSVFFHACGRTRTLFGCAFV
jgi:hypothetical protein